MSESKIYNTGYLKVPIHLKPEHSHLYDTFLAQGTVYTNTLIPGEHYTDVYLEHPDFTIDNSEPVYSLIVKTSYDGYNHVPFIAQLIALKEHELVTIKEYEKDHFTVEEKTIEMSEEEFYKMQSLEKE